MGDAAAQARYRARNRDRLNAERRARYAADPGYRAKDRAKCKRWRKANPERHAQHNLDNKARKAGYADAADRKEAVAARRQAKLGKKRLEGEQSPAPPSS
ncbi:hypothetical protein ACVWYH_006718 [Bradyrhizobium sp. GM24.11]|jgi:hypothetical protein